MTAPIPSSSSARLFLGLAAVFLVLYVPWLLVEPPRIGIESIRILVTREMLRSGDWIVPTLNGETYLAKPPLWYWMIAVGSAPLGGVSIFSARLLAALCTFVLALATGMFARRELGARAGFVAGFGVLLSGIVIEKGMRAELEAPFAMFTGLAMIAQFRAVWSERGRAWWTIAAGLALGAAILVKGPLALMSYVLALATFAIASPTRRKVVLATGSIAIVLSVIPNVAWLAAVFSRGDAQSSWNTFLYEMFNRMKNPGVENREAFWFYVPALIVGFLPASVLLPSIVTKRIPSASDDERTRGLLAMCVGWAVITVVVMSFSAGKETRYLIAMIPGWALLAAWGWFRADPEPWLVAYKRHLARFARALVWIAPLGVAIAGWKVRPHAWPMTSIAVALLLFAAVAMHVGRRLSSASLLWIALLVGIAGLRTFWAGVPMAKKADEYPIESMSADVAARLKPREALVQLGEYAPDVQLLVDHPFRMATTIADLEREIERAPRARYVLARARDLRAGEEGRLIEVASWRFGSTRYRLLSVP